MTSHNNLAYRKQAVATVAARLPKPLPTLHPMKQGEDGGNIAQVRQLSIMPASRKIDTNFGGDPLL